jgi:glycosyltransferase involved in cell wall biosynthesis
LLSPMAMNGIVMVINEFGPVSGGAEKQAERLAAYLAAHDRSVWIITRRLPGFASVEAVNGYYVLRPATWGPGKWKTVTFVLGALWHLWRLRRNYKILHAHLLFGPAFAAALAGRILQKHVIVKLGSSGPHGEIQVTRRRFHGRISLALLRRWVDAIIVLDKEMEAEALSAGFPEHRVYLMFNGIETSSFAPALSREDAKAALGVKGKILVLYVGRLVPQKSLTTLLEAMKLAVQSCPNLHLILVGDGSRLESLQALVVSLDIQGYITFAGKKTNVKPFLNAADIFTLPSAQEGMSNALLEAMTAGLACLATPVGATSEMLNYGQCGLLLPVGDSLAWGKALIDLGRDPNRRAELGKAAYRKVMSEYDFSVIGARYEAFYQNLLTQDSRHREVSLKT